MTDHHRYQNPLSLRYASAEMNLIFSSQYKFSTWRRLWLYLAEAQKEVGLPIKEEQLMEMRSHLDDIDFDLARKKEKEIRHDVMAHIYVFAKACPKAAAIIHLGATSAYVADNTDLIQMRDGLKLIQAKVLDVIKNLASFANRTRNLPTQAYTHFQPAQLTTVGKRACLWIQELLLDIQGIKSCVEQLPFRGVKGTTGTQASFLSLLDGDEKKVKKIEALVAQKAHFSKILPVTGQTYTRKIDFQVLSLLSGITQSAAKFAVDLRLLQHKGEIEEPFESKQVGSSAMAYKRNPMRSERIGSLSRFVQALSQTAAFTASTQWFERTLDDSANKRLSVAESFLATDSILDLYRNVSSGLVLHKFRILENMKPELPFMATENILMEAVRQGGNRQELHERIRLHSLEAAEGVKEEGRENDLLERIKKDKAFPLELKDLEKFLDPKLYTGRSANITREFLDQEVKEALEEWKEIKSAELKV